MLTKILSYSLLLLILPMLALANDDHHGLYASLLLGRGYNHFSQQNFTANSGSGEGDWAFSGRAAVGFNIDHYVAIESGYQLYSQRELKNLGGTSATGKVDENITDIKTVLRFPLSKNINLIGKFGPAYVNVQQRVDQSQFSERTIKAWEPQYAMGLSMRLETYPGLSFAVNYSLIPEDSHDDLPKSEFYAAGFIFNF